MISCLFEGVKLPNYLNLVLALFQIIRPCVHIARTLSENCVFPKLSFGRCLRQATLAPVPFSDILVAAYAFRNQAFGLVGCTILAALPVDHLFFSYNIIGAVPYFFEFNLIQFYFPLEVLPVFAKLPDTIIDQAGHQEYPEISNYYLVLIHECVNHFISGLLYEFHLRIWTRLSKKTIKSVFLR